jgi:hypothetical protein
VNVFSSKFKITDHRIYGRKIGSETVTGESRVNYKKRMHLTMRLRVTKNFLSLDYLMI